MKCDIPKTVSPNLKQEILFLRKVIVNFKIGSINLSAIEMAQQLTVHIALPESLSSIPSTISGEYSSPSDAPGRLRFTHTCVVHTAKYD